MSPICRPPEGAVILRREVLINSGFAARIACIDAARLSDDACCSPPPPIALCASAAPKPAPAPVVAIWRGCGRWQR